MFFFEDAGNNQYVINAYEIMQRQYVLRECDRIPYESAIDALKNIRRALKKIVHGIKRLYRIRKKQNPYVT